MKSVNRRDFMRSAPFIFKPFARAALSPLGAIGKARTLKLHNGVGVFIVPRLSQASEQEGPVETR
jgi:hypothetical protein